MAVYKEEKTNTWRVLYRYTDAKPENCEIGEVEDWGSFAKVYVTWDKENPQKYRNVA